MLDFIFNKKLNKEMLNTGVAVGTLSSGSNKNVILNCLIKGIAIFLGSFGSISGFLSAFSIDYNYLALFFSLLIISVIFSLFYTHKAIFYPGYILTMIIFTLALVKYYLYANSGFQAITNILYKEYSDFFSLLSLRESTEVIENRYVTITVAAIFTGLFISLLLNVTISGYMNLIETFLCTFPFLEIALYIDKKPSIVSIFMILACYIYVGIMQASNHAKGQVPGFRSKEFFNFKFKNKRYYTHQAPLKYNLYSIIAAILCSVLITILSFTTYNASVSKIANNPIRKETDTIIIKYLQTGFTGFFSRYDSTGGIAGGKLGGVSSVRPDFETDLDVTYAPYSTEPVYLRAFIGNTYFNNQWFPDTYSADVIFENMLSYEYKRSLLNPDTTGKMIIKNLDANESFLYFPYVTVLETIEHSSGTVTTFPVNSSITLDYSPFLSIDLDNTPHDELLEIPEYYSYVYDYCLNIPYDLDESLKEFLANSSSEVLQNDADLSQYNNSVNKYRMHVAGEIYSEYMKNFNYTMQPGSTPHNRDFVQYFLDESKRGYCAHFASAMVMLLREKGIPARYVEGYAISFYSLSENTENTDYDYDDFYQGTTLLDDKGVLTTHVNDSQAHAWVEIYLDGYGFVPFEATIPSDDDETLIDAGMLSGLFGGLFDSLNIETGDGASTDNNNNNSNPATADGLNKLLASLNFPVNSLTLPLTIVLSISILIPLTVLLYKYLREAILIRLWNKKHNYKALTALYYNKLCKKIRRCDTYKRLATTEGSLLPQDYKVICERHLKSLFVNTGKEIELFDIVEYIQYSNNNNCEDLYADFINYYKIISKNLRKRPKKCK